ncbi:MAG: NTP transferase domain-containing protein, partial [Mesorhizobium sp.]
MYGNMAGIILAGGLSRRMGGGDKGLLMLGDRPLLAHIAARLAPQVQAMALNANGEPERFRDLGLPVVPDTVPGFPGPLAGVLAGLDWAAANTQCQAIVTAAGDTPFFPPDLAARLAAAAAGRPG